MFFTNVLNFVKNISPLEWVIIGLIIIALFGATIATTLARKSGEAFREVKKLKKNFTEALEDSDTDKKG